MIKRNPNGLRSPTTLISTSEVASRAGPVTPTAIPVVDAGNVSFNTAERRDSVAKPRPLLVMRARDGIRDRKLMAEATGVVRI